MEVIGTQDISSYMMNLKRKEDTCNWKRKH